MGRAKGGNPHPGSKLHVWAKEAGFALESVRRSAGTWCFSNAEERQYWGGTMANRALSSGFATIANEEGFASEQDLQEIASAWRIFVEDENAWFGLLHGEILCWK